jgi:hypothetical protein
MKSISKFLQAAACVGLVLPCVAFAQQPIPAVSAAQTAVATDTATIAMKDAPVAAGAAVATPVAVAAAAPVGGQSATGSAGSGTVAKPAANAERPLTARWLDLTTLTHSERYRNQYGDDGYHYFEDGQQRSLAIGKFKLDAAGKYTIGFRASSGRSFNWAYADYAGRGFTTSMNNPNYPTDVSDPTGDPNVAAAWAADPKGVALVAGMNSAGWEFYMRELYFSAAPVKAVTR